MASQFWPTTTLKAINKNKSATKNGIRYGSSIPDLSKSTLILRCFCKFIFIFTSLIKKKAAYKLYLSRPRSWYLSEMENLIGLLRIHVQKGVNLAVRDVRSSDPYVVIKMGRQVIKLFLLLFCFSVTTSCVAFAYLGLWFFGRCLFQCFVLVVTVHKRVYQILCVISMVFGVELQTILRFDLFKEFFDSVLGVNLYIAKNNRGFCLSTHPLALVTMISNLTDIYIYFLSQFSQIKIL